MRVLVTGGTGVLGREIAGKGWEAGHSIRITSRRPRSSKIPEYVEHFQTDLQTGDGLKESLKGIDVVVHAASDPKNTETVDVEGTRKLITAAREARIRHLIFVSIVGIDRIPFPYYQGKLSAERVIAESGLSYSILRATQFHSFIDFLLNKTNRFPFVLPLPSGFHVQSVATEEVADRLLRAVHQGPHGMLRDFAGPEPMTLEMAASEWKAARRLGKVILPVPVPGSAASAFRRAYNTAPGGELGKVTWKSWLSSKY